MSLILIFFGLAAIILAMIFGLQGSLCGEAEQPEVWEREFEREEVAAGR